ncbi:hypothetical protein L484_001602 [Morus notabilis]|uniref:Uncharacterized protein n=1 Tax=Morus notabilis TaxID=981085 RepID=W9R480_9ROSA|nr:hypothetical protein L484_001602 [Morus notabilis]
MKVEIKKQGTAVMAIKVCSNEGHDQNTTAANRGKSSFGVSIQSRTEWQRAKLQQRINGTSKTAAMKASGESDDGYGQ